MLTFWPATPYFLTPNKSPSDDQFLTPFSSHGHSCYAYNQTPDSLDNHKMPAEMNFLKSTDFNVILTILLGMMNKYDWLTIYRPDAHLTDNLQ